MKLENIKTKTQFWEFADIWYQRAHNLRRIWQDDKESESRRNKACKLWVEMYLRVMKLSKIAVEFNKPMPLIDKEYKMKLINTELSTNDIMVRNSYVSCEEDLIKEMLRVSNGIFGNKTVDNI